MNDEKSYRNHVVGVFTQTPLGCLRRIMRGPRIRDGKFDRRTRLLYDAPWHDVGGVVTNVIDAELRM
jgi:hypothetical protein